MCFSKPRQVHAQKDEGNASQDPRQKDDRKQEDRLVVFVVVLLTGEQLVRSIDIIEIQVQRRRRWMLEIGGISPFLAVNHVTVGGAPVVAGYLTGGMFVQQRGFDDMIPAPCDVPFFLPAHAIGDFFVERHRDGIAADQDRKYDRPFDPVDGIIGKYRSESLWDTQFLHLPGHTSTSPVPIIRYLTALCKAE